MSAVIRLSTVFSLCLGFTSKASPLVERDGRFEINWTTGKVRYFGVSIVNDSEDSYRSAEQRAWADGLKIAEERLPSLFSSRMEQNYPKVTGKISKIVSNTTSVSTTYFGDKRVKVLLESPLQKIIPQLVNTASLNVAASDGGPGLIIKLPKGAKASALVRVMDENGRELVGVPESLSAMNAGLPPPKWFKREADGTASAPAPSIIAATSPEIGVIKVDSKSWQPHYASAIINGNASFVIQ